MISSSLLHPEVTFENRPHPAHDVTNGLDGVKLCVNAAIGLGYNGDYFHQLNYFPSYYIVCIALTFMQNPQYL
jgi:hypothetical protein